MIFNILSVTIAGILGCLWHVSMCGGPSSAFMCLCCRTLSGTPRHGLLRVQQQTLLLRKGTEGSDVSVSSIQLVPGKCLLH